LEARPENYTIAHAYYLPEPDKAYKRPENIPGEELISTSMWIDTDEDINDPLNPKGSSEVKFDIDTYIGPSDPFTLEIGVELWIDTNDTADNFEDSL
jgi:hypothetical protein